LACSIALLARRGFAGTSRLMLAGFTPRLRYLSASKSLFVQVSVPDQLWRRVLLSGMG
jgi:hypothetical protein